MMQIVYFSQKEQFLTQMDHHPGEKIYITPSPAKADGLRERLSGQSFLDVITIAKFTAHLVEHLWKDEERPEVKRKSELLLIFGVLKNKYLPQLGFEQFTQAYNLFSDLRSFTLNEDALTSVLEEQAKEIQDAVRLFWQLLELTGYLDEHAAYQRIAEALPSAGDIEELRKTYIFWGFQHLNGQQVDLLKALAIRHEVIVPFPLNLKERLKKSDWISWLKDAKTEEVLLPEIPVRPKGQWLQINSREISLHLKNVLKPQDQVVLGVSKLSPAHLDFVPSLAVDFKVPHELVAMELKELSRDIKQEFAVGGSLPLLKEHLLKKKVRSLKGLKALQLYQEALAQIEEMTDAEIKVDAFFLKLLSEVAALNQPRTSFVPTSPMAATVDLRDMSSLEHLDRRRRTLLCVDDRFEDIQGLGQNYTEDVQKALSAIGPLKRNELELLFRQWEFHDLFSQGEVLVLMGKETLKHGLIWKRLFSGIELIPVEEKRRPAGRTPGDHFREMEKKNFEGNFSASKLQTFIDCPRKFYFSYVDQVFPRVILEKDFDPMTAGTMVHEIIEKFFKENCPDEGLSDLVKRIMQHYIQTHRLALPRETYLQREVIFNQRAWNGIQFVRNFEKALGEKVSWEMEKEFELKSDFVLRGKIDCMGVSEKFIILLDFKSTTGSSGSEVERMDSVQLWAYAHAASQLVPDFTNKTVIMGFVLLDSPSDSRLFTDDKELNKHFKDLCRPHAFKSCFAEIFKEAQEKILSLSLAVKAERSFPARPRKSETCNFCELNKVCVKSELVDGQNS